nr:ribonuclease H-like domain-containing protein [Tanacetum cinerariifolium]
MGKCDVTFDDEIECDVPDKDNCSPAFTTFSNPLFNDNDDLDSINDESLPDEDVPVEEFKIYSNPLFDKDEINSDKLDPHCFNVESDCVESLFNRDTFIDSSSKFDFFGKLAHVNPKISESDFDFVEEIHLIENLLEENDIVTEMDDVLPPSVENDDDSEREINALEELLRENSIPLTEVESSDSDHQDDLSIPQPPSKPSDAEFDAGKEIPVVMNDKDEDVDYSYFIFVIYPEMFLLLLSAESEDTIFDPGIFIRGSSREKYYFSNPKGGKISGKGKIRTRKLDFDDVYFVNELKFNLFSVSHMCDKTNSVLFTDTECFVLSPEFKLPDENQVLLRVPRENNMYNVNLKNIVPSGNLTCLFAKATLDESNLWHRRLGHINFKTMNKLVKGNLVRGLPSKVFENGHTCVSCKKSKQHRASCKTKPDMVLVTKTQNKTPYELLHCKTPSIGFMRPFGCLVTILNTLDSLGKFDRKVDEGFFVGYSVSSKAFRVFNSRTRIVQETLHNTDGDVAFDEKEPEFEGRKPESKVNVSPSKFEDFFDNSINEDNAAGTLVPAVGQLSANSTNIFSVVGPSNAAASPPHGKSSYDVGAEADFNNLETSITGHTQEEGIDYEEVFSPLARREAISLFLAYASFMGFMVYQTDVKSLFLYETIEEEVYVCQPSGFEDPDHPNKVYKVVMALYGLHQDGKSASTPIDTEKPLLKDPDGEDVDYLKDSPFDLVAYSDSDYAGARLDKKSTTKGCQFLGCRLISWQCKKQTVVATSSTEAEYVAAASCCAQVLWIQNQLLDYGLDQTVSGKDSSNPLMADNLPKIIWYSTHHVALMQSWLVQKQIALGQTTTGKEISNLFMTGRMIADMDADVDVILEDAKEIAVEKSVDVEEREPAKLQEVVEVVTIGKLITEVVIAASVTITAAAPQLTTVAASTLTTAPSAARRRNGVVIRDHEETATSSTIIHSEAKSKDKGKGILVEEPKPLKKQDQIKQDKAYARELEAELNKSIDWDEVIDHVQRKQKEDNTKEQMDEEDSRALKRLSESQEDKAAKNQKLDEEVEELRRHLQIVPNDEDDVYTEATPLACKIITFTTTQLILLVEKRYPLTRFTLDQMVNNVRVEVEEESEVSLELLTFIRQQHQEGFQLEKCLNTSSIKLKIKTRIKLVEQRRKLDV